MSSPIPLKAPRAAMPLPGPLPDLSSLPDVAHIKVNPALPVQERLQRFIADTGNPYLFRVNDTIVHVRYSNQHITLQQRLTLLAQGQPVD